MPQGFSENAVKMGTGVIKAKILSSCLQFLLGFLISNFYLKKCLATLSTSQMKKHISRAPESVAVFFACTPWILSWSGLSPQT